jgi:transcriptional regulator GlxA family with amidase domain
MSFLLLDRAILPRQALAEMPIGPRNPPTRRVEILVFPRAQLLDAAGPLQVLATANELACESGSPAPYDVHVVARRAGPIATSAGLALIAEALPSSRRGVDTLLVAGGTGVRNAAADRGLLRWIARRSRGARRTASVCTGAFLLAATGLLDGKRVTTHWRHCADLARRYPALRVESDPIFVRDGDVWTSAGVTAGIDLALAFVEADLGRAAALAVARHLVVFAKRPGGQAQFSAGLALAAAADFDALHAWMADNLEQDLSVPRLAARAGMSERSFARHYRATTGTTPSRAVQRLRVDAAREALGTTRRSIKDVARRCGFGSEETMRRSFLRVLAVAPRDYRQRFPV